MNKFFAIICLLLSSLSCLGQESEDTSRIIFNAKLNTLRFDNVLYTEGMLVKIPLILNDTTFCKFKILKTNGFNNVIFIMIDFADVNFPMLIKQTEQVLNSKLLLSKEVGEIYFSEFVLAYSFTRNRFYKITGFVHSEFDEFYFDYSLSASTIEKNILKNRKSVAKYYTVEGLELDCLLNSIHCKKISYDKFPCLRPANSRVLYVNGVPFTL
ncbi:MAG TPA: hypothetical protein VMW01_09340 [Williamwhitmania sp.]|nr:hypothetical protein [Williamwhitmania sp.]